MRVVVDDPCGCSSRKRMGGIAEFCCYRRSAIPANAAPGVKAAARRSGRAQIIGDIVKTKRVLMRDGQRAVSTMLRSYFRQKFAKLVEIIEERAGLKSHVDIGFGSNEALWKRALQEVLGTQANVELLSMYQPQMQSIAAKSYARTCVTIGDATAPDSNVTILRRAQAMAQKVTRINETTREQLSREIGLAIDDGLTIRETIDRLTERFPKIEASRIPTIARTEVSRAIDEGFKQAMKESDVVTHCSVIGCQSVEPGIPTWRGTPTCNIEDVPVENIDEVEFHINHTGSWVPSRYRDDDTPDSTTAHTPTSPRNTPASGVPDDDAHMVVVVEGDRGGGGVAIPPRP